MTFASLYNSPSAPLDRVVWSFANSDHHLQIINAILIQKNTELARYLIDPIPNADLPGWLRTHQTMHNDMNSVLAIQGNDLSDVDFNNPDQLSAWLFLHASEHRQAADILEI